jgi:hypothetical protein
MRDHLTLICLALLVGLLGLADSRGQADEGAQRPAAGMGVLTGLVTRGPISPVQGPGLPPAAATAPGVKLLIYGPGRQEIATVRSDAAGRYRVNLPPGSYLVELALEKGRGFSKDLPATVTITPGRETRLNVRIDTGIR